MVAPITDSPKPPPNRITLTLPALHKARAAIFVCAGAGKAPVLRQILERKPDEAVLPSAMVTLQDGAVEWYVDAPAAAELTKTS